MGFQTASTPYGLIVGQMILLGLGLGLSTAPATEAVMGVAKPEQAGAGSAVNDATRLVGGTLGVAIIGSVSVSLYRTALDHANLPAAARHAVQASYAASHQVTAHLPAQLGRALQAQADHGFLTGLHAGCRIGTAVCLLGVTIVLALLPSRPGTVTAVPIPATV